MISTSLTLHAQARLSQRGIASSDLDWALRLGREVEGGLLVLQKDADALARELEQVAARVRRLGGLRLVYESGSVITAYRACPAKQKRLLRRAERRSLEG